MQSHFPLRVCVKWCEAPLREASQKCPCLLLLKTLALRMRVLLLIGYVAECYETTLIGDREVYNANLKCRYAITQFCLFFVSCVFFGCFIYCVNMMPLNSRNTSRFPLFKSSNCYFTNILACFCLFCCYLHVFFVTIKGS